MKLEKHVHRGVKWTALSTIIVASTQLLQISILARYLDANSFGLIAIITMVIGFIQMFADLGISSAIIHKQNISDKQLSTLYWLNISIGIGLYLLIVFLAPLIANFYNDKALTFLIQLTSVTIIIQSFGKQFFVLFEKELKFNLLAKIDIIVAISSLLYAVYLALNQYDIYALIYPLILGTFLKSILLISQGIKSHKPKFYFKLDEVKSFIIFGLYQMSSGIINYITSQFDIIIIGKIFGTEMLGTYSIVKQLVMRPAQIINPIVTRVSFPVMSKVQNDNLQLKNIYLKTINYLSSINFPIYIGMIILAPEIISIFLGSKWENSILMFQILSVYALLRSPGNPVGALTLAKGKPEYGLYWTIGLFFVIPVTIYLSSFYGILGVCLGWVILMILVIIPNWYFLVNKLCGAKFIEYHLQILKPLIISSIVGYITYIIFHILKTELVIINILIVSVLGLIGLYILNSKFNVTFLDTIKSMAKRNE